MKRRAFLASALSVPALDFLAGAQAVAQPLEGRERQASLSYVKALQGDDGGFRSETSAAYSRIGDTTACLRAMRYFGGETPRAEAVSRFVLNCYDAPSGGIGDRQGDRPDIRSTSLGLMSMVELRMSDESRSREIVRFLSGAEKPDEIYIAAAALSSAGIDAPAAPRWIEKWEAKKAGDGGYGSVADTAGAAITILRLGGLARGREGILRSLLAAQAGDGGWSAPGSPTSDLATVYRVVRAIWMLDGYPDLDQLHRFIDRCRNADGGYGAKPGATSSAGPTYNAAIVIHWSSQLGRRHARA